MTMHINTTVSINQKPIAKDYNISPKKIKNTGQTDIVLFTGNKQIKSGNQEANTLSAQRSQLLDVISTVKAQRIQASINKLKDFINTKISDNSNELNVLKADTKGFDFLYSADKKALSISEEAIVNLDKTSTEAVKAIAVANDIKQDINKLFKETAQKLNLEEKHLPEITYTYSDSRILAFNGDDKLIINTLYLEKARNPILLSSMLIAHELSHKKTSVMLSMVDVNDIPEEYRPSTQPKPDEIESMAYIRDEVTEFSNKNYHSEKEIETFRTSPDYKAAVAYYKEFLDDLKDYFVEYEEYAKTPNEKVRKEIINLLNLNNRDLLPISVEDLYLEKNVPNIKHDRLLLPSFSQKEIQQIENKIKEKMPQIRQLLNEYDAEHLSESFKKYYKTYSDHIDERLSRYNEIKITQENIKDGTIHINDEALLNKFMSLKPSETLDQKMINLHRSSL